MRRPRSDPLNPLTYRPPIPLSQEHTSFSSTASSSSSSPLDYPAKHDQSSRDLLSVAQPPQLPVFPRSALSSNSLDYAFPIAPPPPVLTRVLECKPFVQLPRASTKEHFRDITFLGPITLHRFFTCLWLIGSGTALFFIQHLIWPSSFSTILKPDLESSKTWSWIGVIWLTSLPASILSVIGNLLFTYPTRLDEVQPIKYNVVFRIVSRGTNAECLLETMHCIRNVMQKDSLFPYLTEVVTDAAVFHPPDDKDFMHLKVPLDYVTPNGTLFKARALHYAVENSPVPPDTWVVHLDEETRPTSSAIKGIAKFIQETQHYADRNGIVKRIGQGAMTYHRSWSTYPFLTLADMRRTGDDMGHFHLQHRIGWTLFGLHGSYIVCRQDVEEEVGFDVGPKGSITEDAWWVLLAMEKGYRTKWVDGFLDEQSTQSIMDFLKQRRRWYVGLWKVCLYCPAKLFPYRFFIIFNTVTWVLIPFIMPFIVVYMTWLSVHRIPVPLFLRIATNFVISASMLVYLNGLVANMREHGTNFAQGIFWTFLMLITIPIFYFMEATAVFMSLFYHFSENAQGFHVVNKSASTTARNSLEGDARDKYINAVIRDTDKSTSSSSRSLP